MARYRNMSKGWKITALVGIAVLLAISVICIVAGVKSAQEDIGFFEALGQVFGAAGETAGEVVDDALDNAGEVGDAVEASLNLI